MSGASDDDSVVRAIVPCDETPMPSAWSELEWPVQPVRSRGPRRELNLQVDGLRQKVTGRLDRRANDLVRIAAYAFAADQLVSRGGKGDPNRRQWRRELALAVPVADPDFWSDDETTTALGEALGFGSEDRWFFSFAPAGPDDGQLWLDIHYDDRERLAGPDCVALLSGGMDSLCAVVDAVAGNNMKPLVVSHRSAIHVAGPQRQLVAGLAARFAGWSFPEMSYWVHLRNIEARERTRRTRGFLVAALGAATAGQVGVPTVLLPDNGYVSINPPVNAQLVGALNSRGTHPRFLRLVNDLLARVFPDGVRIENPLTDQTRAEALEALARHGCADLLIETRTCAKSRRPAHAPHCGTCSQCVDRRFATVAAGLEDHDPARRYETDVFTGSLKPGDAKTFATSYVGFAQRVEAQGAERLFEDYPELELGLDPGAPALAIQAERLASLLQRHSTEVLDVLGLMVGRNGGAFARRQLREDCLLRLAIGPEPETTAVLTAEASEPAAGENGSAKELPFPAPASTLSSNRIERHGKQAYVVFDGEKALIDRTIGLERLGRLLKWPGQELSALDLAHGSIPSHQGARATAAQEGLSLTGPGRQGPRVDRQAMRDYEARMAVLQTKRREAEAVHHEPTLAEIDNEMDALTDEVNANKGKGGRSRDWSDDEERARTKVTKSLHLCIEAFAEVGMQGLHEHLRRFVHTGYFCVYEPSLPQHWNISL